MSTSDNRRTGTTSSLFHNEHAVLLNEFFQHFISQFCSFYYEASLLLLTDVLLMEWRRTSGPLVLEIGEEEL